MSICLIHTAEWANRRMNPTKRFVFFNDRLCSLWMATNKISQIKQSIDAQCDRIASITSCELNLGWDGIVYGKMFIRICKTTTMSFKLSTQSLLVHPIMHMKIGLVSVLIVRLKNRWLCWMYRINGCAVSGKSFFETLLNIQIDFPHSI